MSRRLAISSTVRASLHPIARAGVGLLLMMAMIAASPAASTQPADKPAPTRLTPNANGTVSTIRDTVVGYNGRGYVIAARKGQTLTVALKTSSSSLYMNVFAPHEETAAFNGSLADTPNLATVKVAADGDYRVDVYLFRASARRGGKAPFTLDVSVK